MSSASYIPLNGMSKQEFGTLLRLYKAAGVSASGEDAGYVLGVQGFGEACEVVKNSNLRNTGFGGFMRGFCG